MTGRKASERPRSREAVARRRARFMQQLASRVAPEPVRGKLPAPCERCGRTVHLDRRGMLPAFLDPNGEEHDCAPRYRRSAER